MRVCVLERVINHITKIDLVPRTGCLGCDVLENEPSWEVRFTKAMESTEFNLFWCSAPPMLWMATDTVCIMAMAYSALSDSHFLNVDAEYTHVYMIKYGCCRFFLCVCVCLSVSWVISSVSWLSSSGHMTNTYTHTEHSLYTQTHPVSVKLLSCLSH